MNIRSLLEKPEALKGFLEKAEQHAITRIQESNEQWAESPDSPDQLPFAVKAPYLEEYINQELRKYLTTDGIFVQDVNEDRYRVNEQAYLALYNALLEWHEKHPLNPENQQSSEHLFRKGLFTSLVFNKPHDFKDILKEPDVFIRSVQLTAWAMDVSRRYQKQIKDLIEALLKEIRNNETQLIERPLNVLEQEVYDLILHCQDDKEETHKKPLTALSHKDISANLITPLLVPLIKEELFRNFETAGYLKRSEYQEIVPTRNLDPIIRLIQDCQAQVPNGDDVLNAIYQENVNTLLDWLQYVVNAKPEVVVFIDINKIFANTTEEALSLTPLYQSLQGKTDFTVIAAELKAKLKDTSNAKMLAFRKDAIDSLKLAYDSRHQLVVTSDKLSDAFIRGMMLAHKLPDSDISKIDIRKKTSEHHLKPSPVSAYLTGKNKPGTIVIVAKEKKEQANMIREAQQIKSRTLTSKTLKAAKQHAENALKPPLKVRMVAYLNNLYGRLIGVREFGYTEFDKQATFQGRLQASIPDRFTALFARTYLPRDVYDPHAGAFGTFKGETLNSIYKPDGKRCEAFSAASLAKGFFGIPFIPQGELGIFKRTVGVLRVIAKTLLSTAKLVTEFGTGIPVILMEAAIDQVKQKLINSESRGARFGLTLALLLLKVLNTPFQLLHYAGKATTSPMKNARDSWRYFEDLRKSDYLFDKVLGYTLGALGYMFSMAVTTTIYTLAAPFVASALAFVGAGVGILAAKVGLGAAFSAASTWIGTVAASVAPHVMPIVNTVGSTLTTGLSFVAQAAAANGLTITAGIIGNIATSTASLAALVFAPLLPLLGNPIRQLWARKPTRWVPKAAEPPLLLEYSKNEERAIVTEERAIVTTDRFLSEHGLVKAANGKSSSVVTGVDNQEGTGKSVDGNQKDTEKAFFDQRSKTTGETKKGHGVSESKRETVHSFNKDA